MGTWISLYGLCRSTEYEFKMQAAGTYSNALARSDYQEICYEKNETIRRNKHFGFYPKLQEEKESVHTLGLTEKSQENDNQCNWK